MAQGVTSREKVAFAVTVVVEEEPIANQKIGQGKFVITFCFQKLSFITT